MSSSSDVTSGTNATATQYNAVRADAILRTKTFVFEVLGSLVVGDEQGGHYIVPTTCTVVSITHKITSGTSATFRVQKDTTDIDSGIVAGTSVSTDSSPTSAALTAGQVLSLDITAVSGAPVDILVQVNTTENI